MEEVSKQELSNAFQPAEKILFMQGSRLKQAKNKKQNWWTRRKVEKFKTKRVTFQIPTLKRPSVKPEGERLHLRRDALGELNIEPDFIKKSSTAERQMLYDIPEIESDEENSNSEVNEEWEFAEKYLDERDDEWLGVDREYKIKTSPGQGQSQPQTLSYFMNSVTQLDLGCEEFMASTKYFWWCISLAGRMPFQAYVAERIVRFKLNKFSASFVYFSLTTIFLTFCTTTMGYSFFRIFLVTKTGPLNFNEQIERVEVDKYWYYALVTFVASAISSSWSLATIFDDGFALADFLTRWNIAISVLKYRPVARIRLYFWLNLAAYLLYVGLAIFLFEYELVPAVKGSAGLVGLMIFRPFTNQLHFSEYFPMVAKFGLFVHLYVAFSCRSILLIVTLYCKLLCNAAKKWNLRLAYVMGMLGETIAADQVVAVISFQKLFLEHTIVVGLLRHTGRIFTVALGIFYSLKMFEFLVLCHRILTLIVYPLPTFNETYVPGTPQHLRVTHTDPPVMLIGSALTLLLYGIAEWLIYTQLITNCGEAMLDGFSFIRRWGLILSKTSQRRRFVQSINHAFSDKSDYFVNAGFTINREFVYSTFFWLSTFSALLIAFHPIQLRVEVTTVCSQNGNCVAIKQTRISWQINSPNDEAEVAKQLLEEDPRRSPSYSCPGIYAGIGPVEVKFLRVCHRDGEVYQAYNTDDCLNYETTNPKSIPYLLFLFGELSIPYFLNIYNCNRLRADQSIDLLRDECFNIQTDNWETKSPAILKAVKVPFNSTDYVMCCYDYGFGSIQLSRCNQVDERYIGDRCGVQEERRRPPYRFDDLEPRLKLCLDGQSNAPICQTIDECICDRLRRPVIVPPNLPGGQITCPE